MDVTGPPEIIVVADGDAPTTTVPSGVPVVAADGGAAAAVALGLDVTVLVGDLDSIDAALLADLERGGTTVRRHPTDKDATDLELALGVAAEGGARRWLVLGIDGGRPDHALANLLALASPRHAAHEIEFRVAGGTGFVVHRELTGRLAPGTTVSFLPVLGPATVSLTGLRWPLDRVSLAAGSTRGVSNESTDQPFQLTVHDGVIVCIIPHPQEQS